MGERRAFGELEGEVLAALWAAESALVPAEVQAAVGGDLAYTTVMTILVRLAEKGLIEREKVGRAYAYRPVVAETDVVAGQVRRLLNRGHDRSAVLQRDRPHDASDGRPSRSAGAPFAAPEGHV